MRVFPFICTVLPETEMVLATGVGSLADFGLVYEIEFGDALEMLVTEAAANSTKLINKSPKYNLTATLSAEMQP
jgi:hypothetical protein